MKNALFMDPPGQKWRQCEPVTFRSGAPKRRRRMNEGIFLYKTVKGGRAKDMPIADIAYHTYIPTYGSFHQ
jgi:hypothetical protein